MPVHKVFLQAHMEVKRVVIQTLKKEVRDTARTADAQNAQHAHPTLTQLEEGAEWPICGKFKKLEKFMYSTIWKAIKVRNATTLNTHHTHTHSTHPQTLVITFDIMTIADLDSLETDEEIVHNADNLMRLYLNADRSKVSTHTPSVHTPTPHPQPQKREPIVEYKAEEKKETTD